MADKDTILCPSSRCEEGAILLGIVMPDGRVAFASDRIVIDDNFVRVAHEGRSPEKRFRFSGTCVKGACKQWTGEKCGVIEKILQDMAPPALTDLPECSIRPQCRWFSQQGSVACSVCPEVITDLTTEKS